MAIEYITRGILGILILLGITFLVSGNRRGINWRIVGGGLVIQISLAYCVMQLAWAGNLFGWFAQRFLEVLSAADAGAVMVFGPLANDEGGMFIFAFRVLPVIIFFSALTALLYYLGILQAIVKVMAWIMSRVMKLSGAESLAAAGNVFLGQTEAPLLVRPYMPTMTKSEMMALMTGGMATIAGSVMAAYITMLAGADEEARKEFTTILLTASLMNAPAALLIAKMMVPEVEEVNRDLTIPREKLGVNLLDALANGTSQGLKLALNVAAMLIAFTAIIALFNIVLGRWIGEPDFLGFDWSVNQLVERLTGGQYSGLSLEMLCGFIFAPIAWVIGIADGDLLKIGQLLGIKIISNEFIAYSQLSELNSSLDPRSVFLATFALCGFANFSSIGIQIGGIGNLVPERRATIAKLAFKAMIGGTLASLLTATIAGMFYVS